MSNFIQCSCSWDQNLYINEAGVVVVVETHMHTLQTNAYTYINIGLKINPNIETWSGRMQRALVQVKARAQGPTHVLLSGACMNTS